MNSILILFVFLLLLKLIWSISLDLLNLRYSKSRTDVVPISFRDFIDLPTYQKSIEYTSAKTRFGIVNNVYDSGLLALLILSGILPLLFEFFTAWFGTSNWGQAMVLFLIGLVLSAPSIPFDWWETFKIEERFGFNKSSHKLWVTDKIKGTIIGFIVGYPLLTLLIYIVSASGSMWWIWGFAVFFIFQLLMVVVYPMFIMPLFNKLEPLTKGDLKSRLFALAERTGFKAKTILVMDGSKRSSHSNAFFAGFGRFRRIVLYDTLIKQMEAEELEAILAHEIGHYKLGHIPKMLLIAAVSSFMTFAFLGWLVEANWFTEAFKFGASAQGLIVPVLLLFMLLSSLLTFWLSPFFCRLSRKHEYEADAFSKNAMANSEPLLKALRKLHKENLSNLSPHPLYSQFYYSHPTLLEREDALCLD